MTAYEVTTVRQLDDLLTSQPERLHPSSLSPAMRLAYSAYLQAVRTMREGRLAEAAELFTGVVETWPGFVAPRARFGRCLQLLGQTEAAERQLKIAIGLTPTRAELYLALGALYESTALKEEEAGAYRDGIEHVPTDVRLHVRLAGAYQALERYVDAREQLEAVNRLVKALETEARQLTPAWRHPETAALMSCWARQHEAEGDWSAAARCWRERLELDPAEWVKQRLRRALELAPRSHRLTGWNLGRVAERWSSR